MASDSRVDTEEGEVDEDDGVPAVAVVVAENGSVASGSNPAFEILFHDKKFFDKHQCRIVEALFALFDEAPQVNRIAAEENKNTIQFCFKDALEQETHPDAEDVFDLSSLFTIDAAPSPALETIKIPSYKRFTKEALNEETSQQKKKKEDENSCTRPKVSASCFNCGSSEHSLRECDKPRNMNRINRARKAFSMKQERYHVDIEQRYAHLRPGAISDNLRAALGLRRGELPFFFYRMRVLGYPPGWLEEAKVDHSGISLFNSDGNAVLNSDEEEGELDPANHKYNISKIIDFPGFNCSPGDNFYDDFKHHNVPPLNPKDMKDEFIRTLGDHVIKGYKRRKLKDLPAVGSVEVKNPSSLQVTDMEIEDPETATSTNVVFVRPPPPTDEPNNNSTHPPPPPPPPTSPPPSSSPPTPATSTEDDDDKDAAVVEDIPLPSSLNLLESRGADSPSLADLEAQQQELLKELQSANAPNVNDKEDSLIDEVLALENTQSTTNDSFTHPNSSQTSMPSTPETPKTPNQSQSSSSLAADIIKESIMGTPIIQFSPYEKLPAGDNFKVGVSDVINFENLPDSTGTYENMKVVIKKVRRALTKLQNDDE